jgi:hypothetical protein
LFEFKYFVQISKQNRNRKEKTAKNEKEIPGPRPTGRRALRLGVRQFCPAPL